MLSRSVAKQKGKLKKNGQKDVASFLLSIAGIFSSSVTNTSENVKAIVAEAILRKYGKG